MSNPCSTRPTNPCPSYPNAQCIVYTGVNLTCAGIRTNDRLDAILAKIDAKLCTSGGSTTFIEEGENIIISGAGTAANPYIINSTSAYTDEQAQDAIGSILSNEFSYNDGSPSISVNEIDWSKIINIPPTANIYTVDGTLEENRAVDLDNKRITWDNNNEFIIRDDGPFTEQYTFSHGVKFENTNSTDTYKITQSLIDGVYMGWNNNSETSTININILSTGVYANGLTNLSTQTRIIGQDGVTNRLGYITIGGADLSLTNGVLSFTGTGNYIQNQFVGAQTANSWISGNTRVDGYTQIGSAGRIVNDGGTISIVTPTTLDTASNLRLGKLLFYQNNIPTSNSTSEIYSEGGVDGNYLNLKSDVLTFRAPLWSTTSSIMFNLGNLRPFIIGNESEGSSGDQWDVFNIYNAGDLDTISTTRGTKSHIGFSSYIDTTGRVTIAKAGSELIDYGTSTYKGDFVIYTANAAAPEERVRIRYDGNVYIKTLDTDSVAPTTTGTTKYVICDNTGLLSNTTIAPGTQTLQQTITTGAVLTGDNTVDGGTFDFTWDNFTDYTIEASGTTFLKIADYTTKAVGDVLRLVDNTTGEVGWVTPGGGGGGTVNSVTGTTNRILLTGTATDPIINISPNYVGQATITTTGALSSGSLASGFTPVTVALGGTNLTSYTKGDLIVASASTTLNKQAVGTDGQIIIADSTQTTGIKWGAIPAVTSIAATAPAAGFTISGSPITTSGTLTFALADDLAAIEALSTTGIVRRTGASTWTAGTTISVAEGGTGTSAIATNGQLLIGNGTNYTLATITPTANQVNVANGSGSITLSLPQNIHTSATPQFSRLGLGTASSSAYGLNIGGSGHTIAALGVVASVAAQISSDAYVALVAGTVVETTTGTHPMIAALALSPTIITPGAASVIRTATCYVSGASSATVTDRNYAIYSSSGANYLGGDIYANANNVNSTNNYDVVVRNQSTGRIETIASDVIAINPQTGTSYILVLTDKGGIVDRDNSSANTTTIPLNSSVAFPIGTQIVIRQKGTGQTTITPTGGVTLQGADGAFITRVQHSAATIVKMAVDTWWASGDLTT